MLSLVSHRNYAFALLIVLMIPLGCLRVIDTYRYFWQTCDEPAHIAAGMEWLDEGKYTYEPFHPPLARVMSALGLYLDGTRSSGETSGMWAEGNAILHSGGNYERNLALARTGILPFFVIASLVVALWAKKLGGMGVSLLSTLLFTTLPPVLAHAGNATLDMACTAFVVAALFSLTIWLNRPSLFHSLVLGVAIGLAILSKFSAIFFLLAAGGLITILWITRSLRQRSAENRATPGNMRRVTASAIALLACALTIWAAYRFSLGTIVTPERRPYSRVDQIVGAEGGIHDIAYYLLENARYPAPEFFQGIKGFFHRHSKGHVVFFLGDVRKDGWWYLYPIVLAVKTPLPFVLLCAIGLFYILRRVLRKDPERLELSVPAIACVCILAVGMASRVQNGLRQVLSVYPLLAIVAGYGAFNLVNLGKKRQLVGVGLVVALLSWHLLSSLTAHPDYLPYFNELAGNHPEEVVADSDLDWGQDLKRLGLTLEYRGVNKITMKCLGTDNMDLDLFDLPPRQMLQPYQRETGWVAVSAYHLKLETSAAPYDTFTWLKDYQPVEQVGKSIWLYYIPEE